MKVFYLKKKHIYSLLCFVAILCLSAAYVGANFDNILSVTAPKRDLPIYAVDRDDNKVAISFDAAWGNEDTEKLIKILGDNNVKATFFVVGEWVDKYPESVKALADAGHEIMNHSNTHPHYPQLSKEQIIAETKACDDKIEKITGKRPFLIRLPYGDYDNKTISTLKEMGHYPIQWTIDSIDWKDPSPEEIINRVVSKAKSGSIMLFHNAAKNTPAALPDVIKGIKDKGLEFVPISEIIYRDDYEINSQGTQIKKTKSATPETSTAEQPKTNNKDSVNTNGIVDSQNGNYYVSDDIINKNDKSVNLEYRIPV